MAYEKIKKLVQRLHDRTLAGTISWEETGMTGIYQTTFPEYSIRIFKGKSQSGQPLISLSIFNINVELIEEVTDDEIHMEDQSFKAWEIMSETYETARRIAMGTEQALDSILTELGDDEIPF